MRVLMVAAPFGAGHARAALAVQAALVRFRPGNHAIVLDLANLRTMRLANAGYMFALHRSPRVWRQLYRSSAAGGGRQGVERWASLALTGALRRHLWEYQPDVVLATHPFPLLALARLRAAGELPAQLAAVVTDFVPHAAWAHPGVDRYFVAPLAAADTLAALGITRERIVVTGIPIPPTFGRQPPVNAPTGTPRVLVMGGSLGLGPMVQLTTQLLAADPHLAVEVVAGHNRQVYRRLSALSRRFPNLVVHGFSHEIVQLMARAHLLVGKPGGLTCSEAMALGLPMVLTGSLPGHEEDNAAVLAATGAVQIAAPSQVPGLVDKLFSRTPWHLALMRAAAWRLGRPDAADLVAAHVLETGVPAAAR